MRSQIIDEIRNHHESTRPRDQIPVKVRVR